MDGDIFGTTPLMIAARLGLCENINVLLRGYLTREKYKYKYNLILERNYVNFFTSREAVDNVAFHEALAKHITEKFPEILDNKMSDSPQKDGGESSAQPSKKT